MLSYVTFSVTFSDNERYNTYVFLFLIHLYIVKGWPSSFCNDLVSIFFYSYYKFRQEEVQTKIT